MGLLESVLGSLMGGGGGASPMQGVLMNMLGGQAQQCGIGPQNPGMMGNGMGEAWVAYSRQTMTQVRSLTFMPICHAARSRQSRKTLPAHSPAR